MGRAEQFEAGFGAVPVNKLLGLRLVRRNDEGAEVRLPVREDLLQETGIVHGGLLATLLDTTAVYALFPGLPEDRSMTSIEFKVNFLRPARLGGGELVAEARVLHRGRTVGVCDVEARQDDRAVARGSFTYLFLDAST